MSDPSPSLRNGAKPGLVAPAAVRIVDIDSPLPELSSREYPAAAPFKSIQLVVRLGGEPLGAAIVAPVPEAGVLPGDVADAVRAQLEPELREALARHGIELPASLPLGGFGRLNPGDGAPTATLPHVTVVVVTCRNPGQLQRCLESIFQSDYERFDVVVVENRAGSRVTSEMLSHRFGGEDRIELIEEPRHGATWARNAGIARASGEIVALPDDDVVVDPGWIRNIADAFARREDVACVNGLILPLRLETPAQMFFEQLLSPGKGFRRKIFALSEERRTNPLFPYTPGEMGSAANMALRTDIAHRVGGFDTSMGRRAGLEIELYIRMLLKGCAIAYEPSAIVWHEHPDEMERLRRRAFRYGVGLTAMLTKHLVAGPERLDLIRRVPAGCRHILDPTSRKNALKTAGYPRSLDRIERLGMLLGPGAYVARAALNGCRKAGRKAARSRLIHPSLGAGARTRDRRALNLTAAAACVLAPATVITGAPSPLRLVAVLALFCLAPGAALLSMLQPRDARVELGLVVGVSLGVVTLGGQSMLWVGLWEPQVFACALAGASLLSFAATWPLFGIPDRLRATRESLRRIGRSSSARLPEQQPEDGARGSTKSPEPEAPLVVVVDQSMARVMDALHAGKESG